MVGFAQADVRAKRLLDAVSEKYDNYRTIQSDFNFSVQQTQGTIHEDKGTLFVNKQTNQFRIELATQEIINDGKSTWSILKEDQEVQVSESENSTDAIGPDNLFTFYKKGFAYKNGKEEKSGSEILQTIELTPAETNTNYAKITLRINKNNHIHDVLVIDKSGTKYLYAIKSLYVNHKIPPAKFKFNKQDYPNYEIVDLR